MVTGALALSEIVADVTVVHTRIVHNKHMLFPHNRRECWWVSVATASIDGDG